MFILAVPALLGTYFGFAGAFGELIYRARASFPNRYLPGAILFAACIFVPASLALPFPQWLDLAAWSFGLALIAVFSIRPARVPTWLWSPAFAYQYMVGLMSVIAIWSLSQRNSPPLQGLGVLAALAGGSAIIKWKTSGADHGQPHSPQSAGLQPPATSS